jgi:hypothetical protein
MDILIKDGTKYSQTDFHGKELLFEKVVFSQYKHLFGNNTILFTKKKIQTATGIGTIPDAFIVDFEKEKWFIIEVEISNHDPYVHIVPQLTKFSSALNNPQTRKQLVKFFESEIKSDPSKNDLLLSNGKTEVFKTVSEIVDSNPELIIIIEQQHDELTSIFNSLPFKGKINVFKTFTRDGQEQGESIFQIEPIFNERRQTKAELIPFVSKKSKANNNDTNIISQEIERVENRVPGWFKKPGQFNSQILISFMELQEKKGFVNLTDLEKACSGIPTFKPNYDAMKIIAPHNSGKVFDENEKNEITLWEPVEEFIKKEYNKYLRKD